MVAYGSESVPTGLMGPTKPTISSPSTSSPIGSPSRLRTAITAEHRAEKSEVAPGLASVAPHHGVEAPRSLAARSSRSRDSRRTGPDESWDSTVAPGENLPGPGFRPCFASSRARLHRILRIAFRSSAAPMPIRSRYLVTARGLIGWPRCCRISATSTVYRGRANASRSRPSPPARARGRAPAGLRRMRP